jgi:hypothetical protein
MNKFETKFYINLKYYFLHLPSYGNSMKQLKFVHLDPGLQLVSTLVFRVAKRKFLGFQYEKLHAIKTLYIIAFINFKSSVVLYRFDAIWEKTKFLLRIEISPSRTIASIFLPVQTVQSFDLGNGSNRQIARCFICNTMSSNFQSSAIPGGKLRTIVPRL